MQRSQIESLAKWWRERGEEIPGFGHVQVTQGKCFETAKALEQLLNDPEREAPAKVG